jgi:hypothetical protein
VCTEEHFYTFIRNERFSIPPFQNEKNYDRWVKIHIAGGPLCRQIRTQVSVMAGVALTSSGTLLTIRQQNLIQFATTAIETDRASKSESDKEGPWTRGGCRRAGWPGHPRPGCIPPGRHSLVVTPGLGAAGMLTVVPRRRSYFAGVTG